MERILEGYSHLVTFVTFSDDGTGVVSGSRQFSLYFECRCGADRACTGGSLGLTSVEFSHDVQRVVSSSYDRSV